MCQYTFKDLISITIEAVKTLIFGSATEVCQSKYMYSYLYILLIFLIILIAFNFYLENNSDVLVFVDDI